MCDCVHVIFEFLEDSFNAIEALDQVIHRRPEGQSDKVMTTRRRQISSMRRIHIEKD